MDNELYHHGVKGMKWGVRKDRRSSSSMKAKRSLKNANAQQNKINRTKYPTHKQLMKSTSAKQIYKNRNRLSDKELDNRINRMEKEQHLKDLSRKQESEGKKWVKKILVGAGTAIASQYAVTYGKKMAEYILKIKHDDSYSDELYHHGIKGMKWGVRNDKYKSRSLLGLLASRQNKKIDNSFNKWKENSNRREAAIENGKRRNAAKIKYETNKTKENKIAYKQANKEYKRSLRKNTTYRKGQVRSEVGSDLSRQYLKVAKQTGDSKYYDKYNIERAKARRAPYVAEKRSRRIASLKRAGTVALKSAIGSAVVGVGLSYIRSKNIKINVNSDDVLNIIKKVKNLRGYI